MIAALAGLFAFFVLQDPAQHLAHVGNRQAFPEFNLFWPLVTGHFFFAEGENFFFGGRFAQLQLNKGFYDFPAFFIRCTDDSGSGSIITT